MPGQLHAVSPGGSQVAPQVPEQSVAQVPLVSPPVQQPSPQTGVVQSAGQLHAVSGGSANSSQLALPQDA
jgi:hypothetical protein